MKDFFGALERCEWILDGMRVDYTLVAGSSTFSVQDDLWRVEVSSDPEGYYLHFTEEIGMREAVMTGVQFSRLAALFGLKLIHVGIHEKGRFWYPDSTSTVNVRVRDNQSEERRGCRS
jgi:hypothetical protein